MNPLHRTLIEKAGYDHGFEHVLPGDADTVVLASARHRAQVAVSVGAKGYVVGLQGGSTSLLSELERSFAAWGRSGAAFVAPTEAALAQWLRRAAALSQALPNQAVTDYEAQVQQALAALPANTVQNTEVQRMVRQRVGQQTFRQAMLDYWGGACAVTGLALPQALRASHAKPWAECASDAERLDVFNGFLLSANLDALFDQFLISFTDEGKLLISSQIKVADAQALGLSDSLCLRWVASHHMDYLAYHRKRFEATTD